MGMVLVAALAARGASRRSRNAPALRQGRDHRRRRHHGAARHGGIGKRASHVKATDAISYIFGYTNFIDGSARGVVPPTNVFYQMKSRDTFAPIGPYIVTSDEIKNPHKPSTIWVAPASYGPSTAAGFLSCIAIGQ
jgi:hypothetical protein